jgi:large subunit ribosomal protein L4
MVTPMIEVPVFNQAGEKVSTFQVDPEKLGGEVRKNLLKQALVMYHANQRQGTVRTQARGEVEGSTRKMFRQKGTGNARTGGIRNPIKKGGGHAKQRRPKDWRQAMPKKARRLARNSAILSKIQSNDIRVLEEIAIDQPKTKLMAGVFKALGIDRSVLFALADRNENLERSARNIDRTRLTTVDQLNAWDILKNRTLLLTRSGMEKILA